MSALNHLNIANQSHDMFRATKLWNEVLHSFFIGVQPKKHRKHMKTHHNSFVASEAVDWLLSYLQMSPHFAEQQISRFQAINLLRKYLKTDVIERVDSKKESQEFQDNKDLYRFTRHANENLPFISSTDLNPRQYMDSTPKSSKSDNQIPNLLNELNLNEKSESFKQILFNKMLELVPNIDDFVRRDDIMSVILMHNMTRVSSNGVVQLTDRSEDLPHWVMSAMKCLANWPKASGSGSCLPKYPGFENDVFAVVRDYFVNIGIPLIPNQLYALIIHMYDKFSIESAVTQNYYNVNAFHNSNISPVVSIVNKMKSHLNSSENLLKTSTPILEPQTAPTTVELPPNHVYETVFMGDIPVTKIVSIDELTNLFTNNPRLKRNNSFRNNYSNKNVLNENKIVGNTRYVDAVTTIPRSGRRLQNTFKSPIVDNIYKSQYESPDSSTSSNKSGVGYYNFGFAMQSPNEDGEYMLCKSVSSLSSINLSPNRYNHSKDNLSAQFSKSSNELSHKTKCTTIGDRSEDKLLKILQMSLFLMPPSNRRHLHLLLRLISKIIENKEIHFKLEKGIELKDYMIKTFTRSILCADKEIAFNELKAQKVVSILLRNCKDLFKVPIDLKEEIDRHLVEKAKRKLFGENQNQFCQQITSEEFELQRDVLSEYALADLLKSIMTDDRLTDRDKLKWIKQFKSYHPEVYDLYFTDQIKVKQNHKNNDKKRINSQNSNLFKRFLSIRL